MPGSVEIDSNLVEEVERFINKNDLGFKSVEGFVEAAVRSYLLVAVLRQDISLRTRIFEEDALLPRSQPVSGCPGRGL